MHEYSIIEALLRQVESAVRAHGATSVQKIRVAIGEQSGVEPDLLATAYDLFRERTVCASAGMEIRTVPVLWQCPSCGEEIPRGVALRCTTCGLPARLAAGDEIILERIEMEVA